uniref:ATP synthase F0 subunit 8 n=1 Tax=Bambusicaliscelis flavus TaxID=2820090 RepID=A0A8A4VN81_9HEMI|nr:ATP synthase F0 subunit 8 [Bambusicaliscelis flavus]QTD82403.1 ATP synthase F0 subunit 8 [Bambusicaliscelis flavus]
MPQMSPIMWSMIMIITFTLTMMNSSMIMFNKKKISLKKKIKQNNN